MAWHGVAERPSLSDSSAQEPEKAKDELPDFFDTLCAAVGG